MSLLRTRTAAIIGAGVLLVVPIVASAQDAGSASLLEILKTQYPPAQATSDGTDLVARGTVVVLQKDNLVTRHVLEPNFIVNGQPLPSRPTSNLYANGVIKPSGFSGFMGGLVTNGPGGANQTDNRKFMSGEKLWVIKVESKSDGVVFTLLSDPINGQRYHAVLKFPFEKGITPEPDLFLATVAQVLRNDSPPQAPAAPAVAANGASTAGALAAEPKTIKLGMTKQQVLAIFGAAPKVAPLGSKEIDFYPDMKVTFVNNKVANIE